MANKITTITLVQKVTIMMQLYAAKFLSRIISLIWVVFSLSIFFPLGAAAATLNDVQFTELPGGKIEVRAQFSGSPIIPKGYSIEQPARIVLDFEGISNNLKEKNSRCHLVMLKAQLC